MVGLLWSLNFECRMGYESYIGPLCPTTVPSRPREKAQAGQEANQSVLYFVYIGPVQNFLDRDPYSGQTIYFIASKYSC